MKVAVSIIVPLLVYFLTPRLLGRQHASKRLLLIGCSLFFISYYLPSPLIYGEQTSFTTHFVGGGLFTGFLWLYIMQARKLLPKPAWFELGTLYALVSALGVANELFEVVTYLVAGWPYKITDTSWDLVANTAGALTFYLAYKIATFCGNQLKLKV